MNTYSLLEDGRIGVSNSLPDLLLGRVWAHNAVLALSSSLRVSPEVGLEGLVLVDGGLEPAVDLSNLWRVPRAARLGLALDVLDAANEATVACHDLCAEVVDLARGHIGAGQHLPEDTLQVGELSIEVVESAVDFTALVEDCIGVGAGGRLAAVVLHL